MQWCWWRHYCRLITFVDQATHSLKLSVVAALLPAVLLLYFGSVRSQVFRLRCSRFYWVLSTVAGDADPYGPCQYDDGG